MSFPKPYVIPCCKCKQDIPADQSLYRIFDSRDNYCQACTETEMEFNYRFRPEWKEEFLAAIDANNTCTGCGRRLIQFRIGKHQYTYCISKCSKRHYQRRFRERRANTDPR